jgi:hypothetical protein
MAITNISQAKLDTLPQELKTAQEAVSLPEVQEMLRKLAEYNLGIFMPHMHDQHTGEFQPLPPELVQVEEGLKVTFRAAVEVEDGNRYFPVAWFWHQGTGEPCGMCVGRCITRPPDTMHYQQHVEEH